MCKEISFTPLEETISFYTRNDYAIINSILTEDYNKLWDDAVIAYGDNKGIIEEYESGIRKIESDYDIKWLNSLKKRIIIEINEDSKVFIIKNAENDIKNIINAVYPSEKELVLYRTAWIDENHCGEGCFPYSREYKSLNFDIGDIIEIKSITSFSKTPYREEDDVRSSFYRYELFLPKGSLILELDSFITHNEEGEVILLPMKFKVLDIIDTSENPKCKGILKIEYLHP